MLFSIAFTLKKKELYYSLKPNIKELLDYNPIAYVNNKRGINVRDKPSTESEIQNKLNYNNYVIIKDTIKSDIIENKKGYWLELSYPLFGYETKSYIFSTSLSKKIN